MQANGAARSRQGQRLPMCHTGREGTRDTTSRAHVARNGDTEAARTARRDVVFAVADGVVRVARAFQPGQVQFDGAC